MNDNTTLSGATRIWQPTSLYQEIPTGTVWRGRVREGSPESVLIASPAYAVGAPGQQRLAADVEVWQKFADRRLPGIAVALHDWGVQPQPFLVVDPPVGSPLDELSTEDGPLPEREALACVGRLVALLHVLHDDLDCALSPTALAQARWDRQAEMFWLPLWQELTHAPVPERRAFDLAQVGALLHGLLLGRPALHLWGQPVLLDEPLPADSPASRGAWRLLRRLLHPNPAQRLASAAALAAEIEHLLHAWDDEPAALLDQAERLFQEAESSSLDKARQADALLAIVARRTPDLPDLDWMQADVAALLAHQQTIETALQLARGRSVAPAVEKLRRAAAGSGDSLVLARWAAALATPDIDQVLIDDGASQRLRTAVEALQRGDLAVAQAALSALPHALPSLTAEVDMRVAFLEATSQANDPAAALAALDQALAAQDAIADADLRAALDVALGGLARWRQSAVAYQATAAEVACNDERIARIRSLRQAQHWLSACSELRTAVGMDPGNRALAKEARLLGMEALLAGQSEMAVDAFALTAVDLTKRRLAQIGWRVARSLVALQADPLGEASLTQTQLAVEGCRALVFQETEAQDELQQLTSTLQKGLEQAAATTGRINSADGRRAAQALAGALQQLITGEDLRTAQPDPLQVLDHAIEQALAADAKATRALLAQRLRPVRVPSPVQKSPPAPPTPDQINQMMQRLISPHFDEVAAALDELAHGVFAQAGAAKLEPLAKEAEQAVVKHKDAMTKVDRLASNDQKDQAERILHDATRNLRSKTCWDPTLQKWVSVVQWQARLDPLLEALMSNDPRRWSRVLDTSASGRRMWSKTVRNLARQRTVEIARHRIEIENIFTKLDSNPSDVNERFQAWKRLHPDWVICWDAKAKDWADADMVEQRVLLLSDPAHESLLMSQEPKTTDEVDF